MRRILALAAMTALASQPVWAAPAVSDHAHHAPAPKKGKPSVREYRAAMKKMHSAMNIKYSGQVDADFARGMIPHHQGAVDMARTVLKYGKDADIRAFAKRIITAQSVEIGQMKRWLAAQSGKDVSLKGDKASEEFKESNTQMHHAMHIKYSGDADLDFVRGMIPHHQGAVDMAWVERRHGNSPEMLKLAEGIVSDQTQEIALMQRWLDRRGAK